MSDLNDLIDGASDELDYRHEGAMRWAPPRYCACGCGRPITPASPSPDFAREICQDNWWALRTTWAPPKPILDVLIDEICVSPPSRVHGVYTGPLDPPLGPLAAITRLARRLTGGQP